MRSAEVRYGIPMQELPEAFTVRDMVLAMFDLQGFLPDPGTWGRVATDAALRLRQQRLQALARAFGIADPAGLFNENGNPSIPGALEGLEGLRGAWLRSQAPRPPMHGFLSPTEVVERARRSDRYPDLIAMQAQFSVERLLRWTRSLYWAIHHLDTVLEASRDYRFLLEQIMDQAQRIRPVFDDAMALLEVFLDPMARSIPRAVMVETHGYPDLELGRLEVD